MSHPNLISSPMKLTFQKYDLYVHTCWWHEVVCDEAVVFSVPLKAGEQKVVAKMFEPDQPGPIPWQKGKDIYESVAEIANKACGRNERVILHVVQFHDSSKLALACVTSRHLRVRGPLTIKERQADQPK